MFAYAEIVEAVQHLAADHVQRYDLDATTPVDVVSLARHLGIKLIYIPCWEEPNFPAVAMFGPNVGCRKIMVNSLLKPADSRFAIAHEIGHIVQEHQTPRRSPLEEMASVYARGVLLPAHVVINQIRHYGGDPDFLAGLNGVPPSAMRKRLQWLGTLFAQECAGG